MKDDLGNTNSLKQKLLKSTAIGSLNQELCIYKKFRERGWDAKQSPYYLDYNTGKYREVDISARKFYKIDGDSQLSFGISFIVECKSISNYHIIVCNEEGSDGGEDLENDWIGNDGINNFPKTIELLKKHDIKNKDIEETLTNFNEHLFPNGTINYIGYRLDSFTIPTYCSFRETNIGQTKELENSVVWKAFQGLYSYIESKQTTKWEYIDYDLQNIENKAFLSTYEAKLAELLESLKSTSNHLEITHPILVVESKLWELKNNDLKEIKYCRLSYEEVYGPSKWIDIVNYDNLDEYLENIKVYDDFFTKNKDENTMAAANKS